MIKRKLLDIFSTPFLKSENAINLQKLNEGTLWDFKVLDIFFYINFFEYTYPSLSNHVQMEKSVQDGKFSKVNKVCRME